MGGKVFANEQRLRGKEISHHQHQEWKTTMYRRSCDTGKDTGSFGEVRLGDDGERFHLSRI